MKQQKFLDTFRLDLSQTLSRNNLTHQMLANKADINQAQISLFLNGVRGLSIHAIIALWPFVYGRPFPQRDKD